MNRYLPLLLFVFLLAPCAAFAGTWQQVTTDTSDFWCPLTDPNRAYGSMAACPANPAGTFCSSSGYCRVNTITSSNNIDSRSCHIATDLYYCRSSEEGSCPLVETSPGGCTQTGTQWTTLPNYTYGGAQQQQWGPQASSCLNACQSSGTNFCTEKHVTDLINNTDQYSCWAVNSGGYQQIPQQTTKNSEGDPISRTTHTLATRQPVYACTAPTYACQNAPQPPTASLSANPVSIVQGQASTLTHSCSNATSASIDSGVGSVNAASGTSSVSPASNTTYTLTCTGAGGSATASVTVAVTPPPIAASCSVSPTSIATGGSATWTATASGGTGSYTYSWSGDDSLTGTGSSVTKTYASAGTKTASVTITSGSLSSTVNCSNSLAVGTPPQPDLTASGLGPASGTAGVPIIFTATALNTGSGASGSFPMLFQFYDWTGFDSPYTSGLAAGGSVPMSASYTFPSPGTYTMRACANYNASGVLITTESNYYNNCGPWINIFIYEPALSCSVNPATLPQAGGTVTYTASGASSSYTFTAPDGFTTTGGPSIQRTFPAGGNTYGMTISKSGYTSTSCTLVTVGTGSPSCGTADVGTFSANPDRVREGSNNGTTLTYSATGIDSACTISGPNISNTPVTPIAGSCSVSGTLNTPAINNQSVYRFNCDSGEDTAEAVVNLIPKFIEF